MNKFLLDTHIWIWNLVKPSQITPRVLSALRSEESELYLSPISLWEVSLLHKKGALESEISLTTWLNDALHQFAVREAPITHEVVRALETIETSHKDPADRFLAATAATLDLTLITSDRNLIAGRGYKTLANR